MIAATPERTAMRDELVREVADRLDVPTRVRARPRVARATAARARAAGRRLGRRGGVRAPSASFLAFVPGERRAGRSATSALPADEQFSSETMRRARDHLVCALRRPARGPAGGRPRAGRARHRRRARGARAARAARVDPAHEHPPARGAPHRARDPPRRRSRATTRCQTRAGRGGAARPRGDGRGHGADGMSSRRGRAGRASTLPTSRRTRRTSIRRRRCRHRRRAGRAAGAGRRGRRAALPALDRARAAADARGRGAPGQAHRAERHVGQERADRGEPAPRRVDRQALHGPRADAARPDPGGQPRA